MAIKIIDNGRYETPVVLCDWCGKKIEAAADGNVQFKLGGGNGPADIFFTHKACCHAFDLEHPSGGSSAVDLDTWLVYLTNRLKWDEQTARAKAAALDSIAP